MKRKLLACLSISSLILSAAMCVTFSLNQEEYKAEAYTTAALPTTIDLNDSTTEEIQAYYSDLLSLGNTERNGMNLLKNLKPILKNGQKYYSYDTDSNGRKVWQAYEITDRDWVKSPASAIAGYNSTTNVITGYSYGTSASNKGSNPYIHALYINRNVDNNVRAWVKTETNNTTSHGGNNEWCIDREHIWPKSHGFENEAEGGARGDLMHLWAGDSYVNSALHSNYYYGFVDTSKSYTNGKNKFAHVDGNLMGKSLTLGGDVTVFEPQDSDKGDIARAVFYMVARYNYLSGSDSDGIDSNNPNLELTNDLSAYTSSGYLSTTTKTGKLGILRDLLEWNEIDPVDEYEIHRNNLLYKNFTNNRNPFIDYPEWANIIWGEAEGYADPRENNGVKVEGDTPPQPGETVAVTGVTLNKTEATIKVGVSLQLTATIAPSNATNKNVTWSSSDSSVATVNAVGKVTAVKAGSATITVKTNDGEKTATCQITVEANEEEKAGFTLSTPIIIGIAVGGVVLLVVVIIILAKSKKARKFAKKAAKKQVKKAVKNSSKKKK